MKKIAFFLSAILAFATIFTSCDVTRLPEGTPLQEPFQDVKMAKQNRDAVYALLIGVEAPNNLNSADIQTDLFHLTYLDNNSLKGFIPGRSSLFSIMTISILTTLLTTKP